MTLPIDLPVDETFDVGNDRAPPGGGVTTRSMHYQDMPLPVGPLSGNGFAEMMETFRGVGALGGVDKFVL